MSRSAEAFGGRRSATRERFERCTPARPCPVCGRKKFCSVGAYTVVCTREAEGALHSGENAIGVFYVHALDGAAIAARVARGPVAHHQTSARAPADVLDRAYRAALSRLTLADDDRAGLVARGLDAGAIAAAGYRSLPERGRAALARAVTEAVGVDLAPTVPGIVWREGERGGYWSFAGWPGLVIPVRDIDGRVVALKIRRSGACEPWERYTWVSSTSTNGPGPGAPVHVPAAALALRGRTGAQRLVITEGELKADVATHLSGVPVVGVPGVGAWPAAVEVARVWGATRVDVAFDNDARTNKAVADAQEKLVRALRACGFEVGLPRWPEKHKGLDDYLLARSREWTVA